MTCHSVHRSHCPKCGAHVWIGRSAYPDVQAKIIAEGGKGRPHVCQPAPIVMPAPIELGPVREEVDWLTTVVDEQRVRR